jgi:SAM-dependent methyltransferase
VIVYAACVGDPEKYNRICLPGLARVAGPDDVVIEAEHPRSIFAAYNEVLDAVRERDDLEALVLLHEDTQVTDPRFPEIVREQMTEPGVAIVGTVGARAIEGLSWWESERFGKVRETRGVLDFGGGTHEVDTVDGLVMALSPWAIRNLRFDEDAYSGFDAYDADICAQARAAGKRVVVTELPVAHLHSRLGNERAESDGGSFERNEAIFRSKWLVGADVSNAPRTYVKEQSDGYFGNSRPEVRALVPPDARRVLDVGCGAGGLGAALQADHGCEVVGIEGVPDAAEHARRRLDEVLCLDLEKLGSLPAEMGSFDTIVFADVLEHLRDPARLVRNLLPSLSDDGVLVLSVPNVKHWTVVYPLLVADGFAYEDAGLLDRTHVHFFTAHEVTRMLAELGLEVTHLEVNDHAPLPEAMEPLAAVAEALGGEREEAAARLGAYQYLVVARRARAGRGAAPAVEPPDRLPRSTREDLLALVPESATRVLELEGGGEPIEPPPEGAFDALVLRHALEWTTDPVGLVRSLLPSLAPDGVLVCAIPNVKHWSVLHHLLAYDRWDNRHLRFFTLEEISNLLDELGLEAVDLVPHSVPLPANRSALLELAVAAGAEREETTLRLSASEYLLVARRLAR